MISQYAMDDIKDMEALGIHLTPSEIVRLNELGLRLERSATSADVNACPRIGWAGEIAVYEPTVQVEEWVRNYALRFAIDEASYWSMYLFACCHALDAGFFNRPEMHIADGVQAEIDMWKSSLTATKAQLEEAFSYAYLGNDAGVDVIAEPSEKKPSKPTSEEAYYSAVDSALSSGLSLSVEEMQTLTETRLHAILRRWCISKGFGEKNASAKPHGDYIRALSAIKKAHAKKEFTIYG